MLFADNDRVKVAIQDQHTNIILIEKMAKLFWERTGWMCWLRPLWYFQTGERTWNLWIFLWSWGSIKSASSDRLLLSTARCLTKDYAKITAYIGRTLRKQVGSGLMSDDLLGKIMIETTAASDARMGGATLPAIE